MIALALTSLKNRVGQCLSPGVVLTLSLLFLTGQWMIFQRAVDDKYGVMRKMGVDIWIRGDERVNIERLQGMDGVEFASGFFRGTERVRMGKKGQKCVAIGVDEKGLVGGVKNWGMEGGIVIDRSLARALKIPVKVGSQVAIENEKGVILGLVKGERGCEKIVYTTVEKARQLTHNRGEEYCLIKVKDGFDPIKMCKKIEREMGVVAFTRGDFGKETIRGGLGVVEFGWATFFCMVLTFGGAVMAFYAVCGALGRDLSIMKSIGGDFWHRYIFLAIHTLIIGSLAWFICFLLCIGVGVVVGITLFGWSMIALLTILVLALGIPYLVCCRTRDLGCEVV